MNITFLFANLNTQNTQAHMSGIIYKWNSKNGSIGKNYMAWHRVEQNIVGKTVPYLIVQSKQGVS